MDYAKALQANTQTLQGQQRSSGNILSLIQKLAEARQAPVPSAPMGSPVGSPIASSGGPVGSYHAGVGIPGGGLTQIGQNGQHWTVAKGAASAFQGLLGELARRGVPLHSDGGYVDRDIRGRPGVKSEHAYGRAIDINAATNGLGSTKSTFPSDIGALAAKYGLLWGGNFRGRKDPMHFEYDK